MLATQGYGSDQRYWPSSKHGSPYRKTHDPRMSDQYDGSLSTQPDWHGQYSYFGTGENGIFSQDFDQGHDIAAAAPQHRSTTDTGAGDLLYGGMREGQASPRLHHQGSGTSGSQRDAHSVQISESLRGHKATPLERVEGSVHNDSLILTDTGGLTLGRHQPRSIFATGQGSELDGNLVEDESLTAYPKSEEDEDLELEDAPEGLDEHSARFQTTAERTAARRKMKRFRLTHQQTRFLVAEFTKQPHPDAAHRERLSKEIPGLSPRQVQVWFQNRRAKIKRLNADDRERMMMMRAVPDDFDNIHALRSPYGAVHGMGAPLVPPVDFGSHDYEHLMRPLTTDVRRADGAGQISPTAISRSFGAVGMSQSIGVNDTEALSAATSNRYTSGNQLPQPLNAGPKGLNSFVARRSSMGAATQLDRPRMRASQSFQSRDSMTRPGADILQSPLRTSISWKGDSVGYLNFPALNTSPTSAERPQSSYQPSQIDTSSSRGLRGFDISSYPGNEMQSATGLGFSGLQQNPQQPARLRAASATMPLSTEFKNTFRPIGTGFPSLGQGNSRRSSTSTTQYTSPSIYTTSYPPAPLSAPIDYAQFRTSSARAEPVDEYATSSGAPAPSDFSQAFQTNMTNQISRDSRKGSFNGPQ